MFYEDKKYIGQECYIIHTSKSELISADGEIHIALYPSEYKILSILIDNANRPIYLEDLATYLWGANHEKDPNSLIPQFSRIRGKLDKIRCGLRNCVKTNHGYNSYTLVIDQEDENIYNFSSTEHLKKINQFEKGYLHSILYCPYKWGACTYDEVQQNTNTCEGILALLSIEPKDKYYDIVEEAIESLTNETTHIGLKSKSLGAETVVPTAMFLYLYKKIYTYSNEKIEGIARNLWKTKSSSGWGIYVKQMRKYANIGCTYWALYGLKEYSSVPEEDFQKYIKSLFKYENTCLFGKSISEVNPRMPSLYSTSMMYIIYNMLSDDSKKQLGANYNPQKAIEFIVNNFDNPFYLSESEGINGVEIDGKLSVHTVNWNHITISYSLTAISEAIGENIIEPNVIHDILSRVEKLLVEYSIKDGNRFYWCSPNMVIELENRGKLIFPTMHLLMGLSNIKRAIDDFLQK